VAEKPSVAVIIPTYDRGTAVIAVLERVLACDPQPAELWIHIDQSEGVLEREVKERFPGVHVLSSKDRIGPGGGRHRCLSVCGTPYAVSLDDDSWPADKDFFAAIEPLFAEYPQAAIFGASIWHRSEVPKLRNRSVSRVASYVGCGHAIRVAAYRDVRGYLARPVAYGMEESDVGLQLFAKGWHVYSAGVLRVYHDTDRAHHNAAEITACTITNLGLLAFLHYPAANLGRGVAQIANRIAFCLQKGRIRGIAAGIAGIFMDCYHNRALRKPIRNEAFVEYLRLRRAEVKSIENDASEPSDVQA
jgi:glycosyltransferase involved in cell wall biosynthesis